MDAKVTCEPRARRMPLPARGGEMAFLDFGPEDRPVDVIFCHANGYNARTYRTILAPLASDLRVWALDLRGHGATTLPTVLEGREGWPEFRDDLLAFLAAAVEGPVILAGHSMGGTTGLLAAGAEPSRVRALALFDPVLFDGGVSAGPNPLAEGAERRRADFPSKSAAYEAYLGRGGFKTWRPEQLADYVEAGFRETDQGVTLACRPQWEASNFRNHRYDPWRSFQDSRCPIRMLRAEQGSTARIEGHEAELAATGRIAIDVVPGTTHFLPMERPDLVQAVLREMARR
jgi:pimeloyl-ACP methyl ester carboxylesterase